MSFHRLAALSLALLMPACLAESDSSSDPFEGLVDVETRCLGCTWGPPMTNTHGVNGLTVSALDTTGVLYDGWRLVSVEIPTDRDENVLVTGIYLKEGVLFGTGSDDNEYSGEDFVDSVWTVYLEETDVYTEMEIHDFTPDTYASRYTFVGDPGPKSGGKEGFTCAHDPETDEYSVVLFSDLDVDPETGVHFERPDTIYFGCVSGAVRKAAVWGYSPWYTSEQGHQTATRAARADYCGDGISHTLTGTGLQIEDAFNVRQFTDAQKSDEAMWGPNGALCLEAPRLGQDPDSIECNGQHLPRCEDGGFSQWPQALLWTKIWN
jgi:hypothetical protein